MRSRRGEAKVSCMYSSCIQRPFPSPGMALQEGRAPCGAEGFELGLPRSAEAGPVTAGRFAGTPLPSSFERSLCQRRAPRPVHPASVGLCAHGGLARADSRGEDTRLLVWDKVTV